MQSGISASPDLHTALTTLVTSTTQRALLATIQNEQIVPSTPIPSTGSTFLEDLPSLAPHLTPTSALYILLRTADSLASNSPLTAITYIPNSAPVRQKTLFASTRLTLLRDLGSEHFAESLFVTEAHELSPDGWQKHIAHSTSAAPLTEEERGLQAIKEQEAIEGGGTRGKGLVQGGQIAIRADDGIGAALKALGEGGAENLVQLRMDVPTETLQLVSSSEATAAQLATAIEGTEPRFSFYRHDDAERSIVFISTCPSAAKIKERMLYAASRGNVISLAQTEGGLKVAKRIEATNPDEVTAEVIKEEFRTEDVSEKKGFAKPKRPGRR